MYFKRRRHRRCFALDALAKVSPTEIQYGRVSENEFSIMQPFLSLSLSYLSWFRSLANFLALWCVSVSLYVWDIYVSIRVTDVQPNEWNRSTEGIELNEDFSSCTKSANRMLLVITVKLNIRCPTPGAHYCSRQWKLKILFEITL